MTLDESQRKQVAAWIADGLKLSDIQNRIASDLGVRLTYMEVRLLVDDLKLMPKDPEPAKPAIPSDLKDSTPPSQEKAQAPDQTEPSGVGKVSVSVDQLARPGAIVSGKVTFSDGKKADWYLDQTGRLGLVAQQQGYRPSPGDLQQFQMALESELAKMGF